MMKRVHFLLAMRHAGITNKHILILMKRGNAPCLYCNSLSC